MLLPVVLLCLTAVLTPSTGQEPEDFDALSTSRADQQKLIVDQHNNFRREVIPTASNMLKMEWSPEAAKNAQNWANQCTLNHSPDALRRTNVQCGENIFMSTAPYSWPRVTQSWYNEKKDFIYGTGARTKGSVIGHYTQVVWHSSHQVGCAVAYCPDKKFKFFFVCHYCPPGNIRGSIETPYKAGPPCGDCPNACENGLCREGTNIYLLKSCCENLSYLTWCQNI